MPPAFNLSQDQTLQFNLYAAILISPFGPIDLTQSEFILLISTSCELLLLCLEINLFSLSFSINSSIHIPTLIGCFIWILKNFSAFAVDTVASKRCALYRSFMLRQSIFNSYFFTAFWYRQTDCLSSEEGALYRSKLLRQSIFETLFKHPTLSSD